MHYLARTERNPIATIKPTVAGIPVVSYNEFWDEFFWQQSKHITIIGTTGCGKTTLELDLMTEREYIIFLGTKEIDDTQAELGPLGFQIASDPKEISLDVSHKWVLHPGQIKIRGEGAPEMKK